MPNDDCGRPFGDRYQKYSNYLESICYNAITITLEVEIGFLNTSYTVNMDDGLVDIQVELTNEGVILGIPVKVRFFISQSQSDRGKSNLCI